MTLALRGWRQSTHQTTRNVFVLCRQLTPAAIPGGGVPLMSTRVTPAFCTAERE